jgi:AraC-like DNA-binding protein
MIQELSLNNCPGNRLVLSSLTSYQESSLESSFYSIKYVLQGTEYYQLDNKSFAVSAGEFLVAAPDKTISVEIKSEIEVNGICLFISKNFFRDVERNLIKNENFLLENPFEKDVPFEINELIFSENENALGKTLQQLREQLLFGNKIEEIDGTSFFYNLSVNWLRQQNEIDFIKKNLEVRKKSTQKELLERLQKARYLINDQPGKQWSMQELSSAVSLSEFHFYRTFKKAFKVTPYQYIIARRIEKACKLLQDNSSQMSEIALSSGFADIYSFSKAFKKFTGICPSAYRQK